MRSTALVTHLLLSLCCALAAIAQPPEDPPTRELIVLVMPGTVTPQEVVDAVNNGDPVPGDLGEGNPMAARMVVGDPAHGRLAEPSFRLQKIC